MSSLIFLYSTHHPIHSYLPDLPSASKNRLESMLGSPTDSSTSSCTDSPVSQHPPIHAWPSVPRARRAPEPVKTPRFYSTPLDKDSPDSTPLQRYGLEEREPSIMERPKLLHRVSHALDDIKEDFSLPAERLRASRRLSTLILTDSNGNSSPLQPPRSSPNASSSSLPVPMERAPPRSMSSRTLLAIDAPARRLSRRLSSSLSFSSSKKKAFRDSRGASISQPNLIGASTQI
ncbi:hypothetical protein BDV59DRAFT_181353 [Aspergillus ambiguus]|uniref:uncharacterized protein n=1 Tax=Aspergillus ambiguus TaxID=176160 RepID=UPI003CCD42D1